VSSKSSSSVVKNPIEITKTNQVTFTDNAIGSSISKNKHGVIAIIDLSSHSNLISKYMVIPISNTANNTNTG
jgi:hypothetical protein